MHPIWTHSTDSTAYDEIDSTVKADRNSDSRRSDPRRTGPDHRRNVGILWSPTTGPGSEYTKRHPVPFGEYIPLRSIARLVSSDVDLVTQDMVAGTGNGLVTGGPFPIGDVICFEVAYDGLVRSSVRAGAQLLVVQTNNATFGHTAETYQQLAMSQLRAVETGRTVLQVATTGMSAVIGPDGTIRQRSGALYTPDIIVASVPLRTTHYAGNPTRRRAGVLAGGTRPRGVGWSVRCRYRRPRTVGADRDVDPALGRSTGARPIRPRRSRRLHERRATRERAGARDHPDLQRARKHRRRSSTGC